MFAFTLTRLAYMQVAPFSKSNMFCLPFSICACHPCAGAVLIFSASFQFERMIPTGNPVGPSQV